VAFAAIKAAPLGKDGRVVVVVVVAVVVAE
jgi:hypothetical protein